MPAAAVGRSRPNLQAVAESYVIGFSIGANQTMDEQSSNIIRTSQDRTQLRALGARLIQWLDTDLNRAEEPVPAFTESRARAVLRAADTIDGATLQDFASLMENEPAERVALYDLLSESGLGKREEVRALTAGLGVEADVQPIDWLSLVTASHAWKSGYALYQLDPASPPSAYSPAGQVLKRAAHFLRRQVQRSATERDKLNRQLILPRTDAPSLEELSAPEGTVAPLPPHYRPPVPESYPEMASETLSVDPDESLPSGTVTLGDPLVITEEEVAEPDESTRAPATMPPITISSEQVAPETRTPPSPMPSTAVVLPNSTVQSRPSFTMALRQMLGQEELTTTKLRVLVQRYPDGPPLYALQVRVTCKGIKSYVAGTTDRDGQFVAELPVRMQSGLTYDVAITWPRDEGGDVEHKSITLNSDRTQFTLPFYRQLAESGASENSS